MPCVRKGSTPLSRPQRIWCQWVSDRVGPPKPGFGHRLWSGRGGTPPHLIRLFFFCDACCNRITRQPRFALFYLIYRNCIPSPHSFIASRGNNGRAATRWRPSADSLLLTRPRLSFHSIAPSRPKMRSFCSLWLALPPPVWRGGSPPTGGGVLLGFALPPLVWRGGSPLAGGVALLWLALPPPVSRGGSPPAGGDALPPLRRPSDNAHKSPSRQRHHRAAPTACAAGGGGRVRRGLQPPSQPPLLPPPQPPPPPTAADAATAAALPPSASPAATATDEKSGGRSATYAREEGRPGGRHVYRSAATLHERTNTKENTRFF